MIKRTEIREWIAGANAVENALLAFRVQGEEAFPALCRAAAHHLAGDDTEWDGKYTEALADLMRDGIDAESLMESICESSDATDVLAEYAAHCDLPEYSEWEQEHLDGLADAEGERRFDAMRDEGLI